MEEKNNIIKDGKKVRLCYSNIAKSNPFTYHIYFTKWWNFLFPVMPPKNFFIIILQGVIWILQIIPWGWIVSLIYAYKEIKRARKVMEEHRQRVNNKIK